MTETYLISRGYAGNAKFDDWNIFSVSDFDSVVKYLIAIFRIKKYKTIDKLIESCGVYVLKQNPDEKLLTSRINAERLWDYDLLKKLEKYPEWKTFVGIVEL